MYSKNIWKDASQEKVNAIMNFCEDYKHFISVGKTERICVKEALKIAESKGFKNLHDVKTANVGDKLYLINKNKNIVLFTVGQKPVKEWLRVLGAHIDSPRLYIKQNPLYEKDGFALLDTHYYGGVKKYQWVTIPLAIHGVIIKKDGTTVNVAIGDDENDPVLGISDLLIHLAGDQMQKTASKVIEGEDLDVTFGSIPLKDEEKNAVKANILKMLNEKYQIEEEDLLSAELEVVPAGKARDYGFDRSMVAGYGQDDKVCAYTSLRAIFDVEHPKKTAICILVDKEEIGSVGNTGMESRAFETFVGELLALTGEDKTPNIIGRCFANSDMLSADVDGAFDPIYASVAEKRNASFFGNGVGLNKYTGARGKSGANDANAEYVARLRKLFDDNKVRFQISELGKVDEGGGGTIAYILANKGFNVIDCGTPVLSMHSPYEVTSKFDVYMSYKAYKVFMQ